MLINKLINRCKRRKVYILILSFFWLFVFMINDPLQSDYGYDKYTETFNNKTLAATPVLQKGISISQTFTASKDCLESVSVLIAAYARTNSAKVKVSVQNSTGNIIYCEEQDTSAWQDNTYYSFNFPRQNNSRGKYYTISFEGIDGNEDNSPALWNTQPTASLRKTIINDAKQDFALAVKVTYWGSTLKTSYIICWGILILLSYIFTLILQSTDEKTFLAFSLLLGSLFIVFNPFFHLLDEETHFLKSFCISRFDWLNDFSNGQIGSYVPKNYNKIIRSNAIDIKSLFDTNINNIHFSGKRIFNVNPYVASVIPLNHIVAAIGIFIGRLLNMSVIGVVWTGRLVNYIYYTVICYLAIKNAKYYKSIFFIVATLPMTQWLAASYSTDPVLLSSTLLFISICLKYKFADADIYVSKKDIGLLLITGASIASVKYFVYTPILLIFFLIPRKCFAKRHHSFMIGMATMILIGLGIIQIFLLRRYPYVEDRNGHVNIAEQLVFMKDHIIYTLRNFSDYFVTSIYAHITNFFYYSAIPSMSALLSVITVLCTALSPDKYIYKSKVEKRNLLFLFLFIAITVYFMTIVALYVGYTPVGSYGVQGIQTRYLAPILFFIMASLASAFQTDNHSQKYSQGIAFMAELSILLCLAGSMMNAWNS